MIGVSVLKRNMTMLMVVVFLSTLFSSMLTSSVNALSAEQRALYQSGINWYDIDSGFCGSGLRNVGSLIPGKLYILGDSITDGAEDYLREQFTGTWDVGVKSSTTDRINGVANRSVSEAVNEINKDSALVADSVAIVIALGTNDGQSNFSSTISETIKAVRGYNSIAPIFWVDIAVTSYDPSPGNSGIYGASANSVYEIIPWYKTVFPNSDPVAAAGAVDSNNYLLDGIHPTETGYGVYSKLVYDFVSKYQIVTGGAAEGTVNVAGSNNEEKAYNFFRSKGLSPMHAAAVLGNFYVESGIDPARKQGIGYQTFSSIAEVANSNGKKGYGLAQWTHDSRQNAWVAFTKEKGWDIIQLESQLEWAWNEWTTGGSSYGYDEFLKTTDLRQAAWVFVSYYERPGSVTGYTGTTTQPTTGDALDSLNARDKSAQVFFAQFSGNAVTSVGGVNQCITGETSINFSASGVKIDESLPWIGKIGEDPESNCTAGFTDGANSLKQFVLDVWQPPVTGVGGYNCRAMRGNDSLTSVHGVGRAIDISISALNPAELAVGNEIRNWMISNSISVGVQRVIWNRKIWTSDTEGWNEYCNGSCNDEGGSKSPHTDHLHVEINEDGANKLLDWYSRK